MKSESRVPVRKPVPFLSPVTQKTDAAYENKKKVIPLYYASTSIASTAKEKPLLISDAVWEWDMTTGRISGNRSLMQMMGYKEDQVINLSWWLRRIHPEDLRLLKKKIKDISVKYLCLWEEQYRFRCGDGNYKQMQDRVYVIYENGLPVRMIGSPTDMSEVRKLKYELANERIKRQIEISETALRVQEMERTRLGHELHDNVNQILSTARLFIDTMDPATAKDQQARHKSMEYILLAIDEIRKLSRNLVSPQLKEKGLAQNIQGLIDDINLTGAMHFELAHDEDLSILPPGKKIALFRIVQEQIKNILKHSQAKMAGICLRIKNKNVVMKIWDDGKGFIPNRAHEGIGISNIRERVLMYNGKIAVRSSPGKGCQLTLSIPVL